MAGVAIRPAKSRAKGRGPESTDDIYIYIQRGESLRRGVAAFTVGCPLLLQEVLSVPDYCRLPTTDNGVFRGRGKASSLGTAAPLDSSSDALNTADGRPAIQTPGSSSYQMASRRWIIWVAARDDDARIVFALC